MVDADANERVRVGLKKIRLLHRLLLTVLVCYLPLIYLLYIIKAPQACLVAVVVLLVLGGLFLAFSIGFCRCPDCGQLFHVQKMSGSVFTQQCMNCGIGLKSGIRNSDNT